MSDARTSRAAEAQALRAQGASWNQIAASLGVSATTARRWAKPGFQDRLYERSREAKQRRKQPCVRGCGNLTSWDRPGGVCYECYTAEIEPPHGTHSRYTGPKYRCRCDACRAANTQAMRDWVARKKAAAA